MNWKGDMQFEAIPLKLIQPLVIKLMHYPTETRCDLIGALMYERPYKPHQRIR